MTKDQRINRLQLLIRLGRESLAGPLGALERRDAQEALARDRAELDRLTA